MLGEQRPRQLEQPQRREHVHAVERLELGERIALEWRQRAGSEPARVVDDELDLRPAGRYERAAMCLGPDVARQRDNVGERREPLTGGLELALAAGVDDEPPVAPRQLGRQRQPEPAGRACDDCSGHGAESRRRAVSATIGRWA